MFKPSNTFNNGKSLTSKYYYCTFKCDLQKKPDKLHQNIQIKTSGKTDFLTKIS